ncbi:hypothetical protein BCR37DRAFT_390846 [Protomyces lactucae-debilis]|uniref:G patch domain-containing protein n=1 Tax=Protomyces lactucae-debilis TaxID=2754530 RepID=A0A1Y2FT21_PROLT|nr:uncharacterized protein BCR37DRAFT_390846 [Protomyces lactucae-debilis]ORY87143.1 hypothetical protein BCR37DRAFT_390846 [Protomyces lactucae-debilis]
MSDWRSHDAAQDFSQKRKRELESGKAVSYGHRFDPSKHEREQEVHDEHGRRRLHGAFTGGFSAGYFGTVGSKEGWAPTSFVSSRTKRATAKSNVMDFMDAEDIADLEETMEFKAARDANKLKDDTERQQVLHSYEEKAGDAPANDPPPALKKPSRSGGMATVSLLLEEDDEQDAFDIGPKISYDKTLAKQKKVKLKSAANVQHTFKSSKEAQAKAAKRQALLQDLDGAAVVQEKTEQLAPVEDKLRPAAISRPRTFAPANEAASATLEDNIPPWRRKASAQPADSSQQTGPALDTSLAAGALKSTFDPYAQDAAKSKRYRTYLSREASEPSPLHINVSNLDSGVFTTELAEFQRAALMFGSSSGAMAKRFTSSTGQVAPEDIQVHVANEDQVEAAKLGLFGHRTRVVEPWFPTRLLCKRFGLTDPHPEGKAVPRIDMENRTNDHEQHRAQIETLMQTEVLSSSSTTGK